MSVLVFVGLGLLGGLGAVARFLLDGAVYDRVGGGFPWGTLAVNVSGALVRPLVTVTGTGSRPPRGL